MVLHFKLEQWITRVLSSTESGRIVPVYEKFTILIGSMTLFY